MDSSGKRVVAGLVKNRPWIAVYWNGCRTKQVAEQFPNMIDEMIFDRKPIKALELAFVFRGLAAEIQESHSLCKAEACLGSAFRNFGHPKEATEQMQHAEALAGSCDDCLGMVYWRWGHIPLCEDEPERALDLFNRSLACIERTGDRIELCNNLLCRSVAHRDVGEPTQGFADVNRAIDLITPTMPSRYFITAAVNILALAVESESPERVSAALEMIETLKARTQGLEIHAKARPLLRWTRALAYDRLGDGKRAVCALETAISGLDRFGMLEEKKAAMADLARIRRKGKQLETNDRHIQRLIEECLRLENDPETIEVLQRARREPSEQNLLAWRTRLPSRVPCLEPVASAGVIV